MTIMTSIHSRDIPDAWFQCVSRLLDVGRRYEIQHGSYVGQTRLEFDWVSVMIRHPYTEPWDLMLPDIPPSLGIPNPVESGYIEQYLPYLMTAAKQPGEDYTYGERLTKVATPAGIDINQVERFIDVLKKTPNTNQAILQVACPADCQLHDPPCLRHIDIRCRDSQLLFYPYFRSWDLWGGFPANLAAIAVLQKYMADAIGVDPGPMICASKGLHLYGYVEELAKLRCQKDPL